MTEINPLYGAAQSKSGIGSLYNQDKGSKINPLYTSGGQKTDSGLPMLSMDEIDPDYKDESPKEVVSSEEIDKGPDFVGRSEFRSMDEITRDYHNIENNVYGRHHLMSEEERALADRLTIENLLRPDRDIDLTGFGVDLIMPSDEVLEKSRLTEEQIKEIEEETKEPTIIPRKKAVTEEAEDDLEDTEPQKTPQQILDDAYEKYKTSIKSGDIFESTKLMHKRLKKDAINTQTEMMRLRVQTSGPLGEMTPLQRAAIAQTDMDTGTAETTLDALIQQQMDTAERNYEAAKERLNHRNFITSGLTERLLNAVEAEFLTIPQLNKIVLADEFLNPVTAAVEIPHIFADVQENVRDDEYGQAALNTGIGILETAATIPIAKLIIKPINATWKVLSGGRTAYDDVAKAIANETKLYDEKVAAARSVASDNKELRTQLIREMEEELDVKISKELKDGNLVPDPDLVREAGTKKISDYYSDMGYVGSDGKTVNLTDYAINDDALALPILDPDKMDIFVSTIVDLKSDPKFAAKLKVKKGKPFEDMKGERLIDKLFDLTLDKELLTSPELLEVLTKNGLSFEEYVLGIVGSGSKAGKLLNRLSQINRIKPKSVKELQEIEAKIATQNALGKMWTGTVLRGENIRRGLMVSSLATAVRNFQSALIRAPMESLSDIMDTAILTYGNARHTGKSRGAALVDFHNAVNPLVRDGTWSGSFNNLRYMFLEQNRAEEFTDYILNRPELSEQFDKMFNSIGEIQKATGRGQSTSKAGYALDQVMSRGEDLAWAVNGPNRWQEHVVRRATFLAELERQLKVKWDVDLQQSLKEGKIQDLLNDAPSLRPEEGDSFLSLVEASTTKALDVTYALPPDFAPFKVLSNFITKSGLTVIVPFPRFMFRSMEYIAQNVAGIPQVAIRKALFKESRDAGLTARDRQDITRNLVGLAALKAMYDYRTSEHATENYTMMAYKDKQADITAQYPLRQASWITDFARRQQEGTLDTWFGMGMDEITETFLGTVVRTGTGNVFVDEITEIIKGTEDEIDEEVRSKRIGRVVGQYVNTFLTPIFQIPEAQRALDIRTKEAKDFAGSVDVSESTFENTFYEQIARRGLAAPSFEEELPNRVTIDEGQVDRPDAATRLFAGITIKDRDSDVRDYLTEIGYDDATYVHGSKSRIPELKLAENEFLENVFPTIVTLAKDFAESRHTRKREQHRAARVFIREAAEDLRAAYNDPEAGLADQRAILADQLRRLSKDERAYGIVLFKDENKRMPDITSLEDLTSLIAFSKLLQGIDFVPKN